MVTYFCFLVIYKFTGEVKSLQQHKFFVRLADNKRQKEVLKGTG